MGRSRGIGTLLVVAAVLLAAGCGTADPSPGAKATTTAAPAGESGKVPALDIEAGDFFFDLNGVSSVPAGSVDLTMANVGKTEDHLLMLLRPKTGSTVADVIAAANSDFTGIKAQPLADFYGGINALNPGSRQTARVELDPGEYVVGCFIPSQTDLKPHSAKGMVTKLTVTEPAGAAAEPVEPPKVRGTVDQNEFAFAVPADFDGKGTWKVANTGSQIHELGIAKLAAGKTEADVTKFFAGIPTPPAPFVGAGGFGAVSPGKEGYMTLDLAPGDYVMVCLVGDPNTKRLHLADGMVKSFTVP